MQYIHPHISKSIKYRVSRCKRFYLICLMSSSIDNCSIFKKKIENMKVPRQTSSDQKNTLRLRKKTFDFLLKKTRKNDTKCVSHNIDV